MFKMNLLKALHMTVLFGLTSLNVLAEGNGAWWQVNITTYSLPDRNDLLS